MTNPLKVTLLSATLLAFMLPLAAQTSNAPQGTPPATPAQASVPAQANVPAQTSTPAQANTPSVGQRKERQQDRISQGIGNGSLTAGEANSLEKQETNLNHEETDMRKEDGGKLTAADKAALQQQQDKISKEIHADKHNSATQNENPKSEEGKRAETQQDRIAQGVRSGSLNAGETSNLEKRESSINREVAQDRAANGGHLTAQERAKVNAQQNKVSKQIYKDKHNNHPAKK